MCSNLFSTHSAVTAMLWHNSSECVVQRHLLRLLLTFQTHIEKEKERERKREEFVPPGQTGAKWGGPFSLSFSLSGRFVGSWVRGIYLYVCVGELQAEQWYKSFTRIFYCSAFLPPVKWDVCRENLHICGQFTNVNILSWISSPNLEACGVQLFWNPTR
jgi:hypothetical protein